MANPTFENLFGVIDEFTRNALTSLALPNTTTDPRFAVHQIVELLQTKHDAFVAANAPLTAYSVVKEAENIDIDTQRQIFTFTFDMKIAPTTVENEPA